MSENSGGGTAEADDIESDVFQDALESPLSNETVVHSMTITSKKENKVIDCHCLVNQKLPIGDKLPCYDLQSLKSAGVTQSFACYYESKEKTVTYQAILEKLAKWKESVCCVILSSNETLSLQRQFWPADCSHIPLTVPFVFVSQSDGKEILQKCRRGNLSVEIGKKGVPAIPVQGVDTFELKTTPHGKVNPTVAKIKLSILANGSEYKTTGDIHSLNPVLAPNSYYCFHFDEEQITYPYLVWVPIHEGEHVQQLVERVKLRHPYVCGIIAVQRLQSTPQQFLTEAVNIPIFLIRYSDEFYFGMLKSGKASKRIFLQIVGSMEISWMSKRVDLPISFANNALLQALVSNPIPIVPMPFEEQSYIPQCLVLVAYGSYGTFDAICSDIFQHNMQQSVAGIIVINTDESLKFTSPESFWGSQQRWPFPVFTISLSNGQKLAKFFSQEKPGKFKRFMSYIGLGSLFSSSSFVASRMIEDFPWEDKDTRKAMKLVPTLKKWKDISDRDKVLRCLEVKLKIYGADYFPFHVLVLSIDQELSRFPSYCVGKLYETVINTDVSSLQEILERFIGGQDFTLPDDEHGVFAQVALAAKNFVSTGNIPQSLFWGTMYVHFALRASTFKEDVWSIWKKEFKKTTKESFSQSMLKEVKMCLDLALRLNLPTAYFQLFRTTLAEIIPMEVCINLCKELKGTLFTEIEEFVPILTVLQGRMTRKGERKTLDQVISFTLTVAGIFKHSNECGPFMKQLKTLWSNVVSRWDFMESSQSTSILVAFKMVEAAFLNDEITFGIPLLEVILQELNNNVYKRLSEGKTVSTALYLRILNETQCLDAKVTALYISKKSPSERLLKEESFCTLCKVILERYASDVKIHEELCGLIISSLEGVKKSDVLEDLFKLRILKLFCVSGQSFTGMEQDLEKSVRTVLKGLSRNVKIKTWFMNFVNKIEHLAKVELIYLTALRKCLCEDQKALGSDSEILKCVVEKLLVLYTGTPQKCLWASEPSSSSMILWDFVTFVTGTISFRKLSTSAISWCSSHEESLMQLSKPFSAYHKHFNEGGCTGRSDCSAKKDPIKKYFHWAKSTRDQLCSWKSKFTDCMWTEDDIEEFSRQSGPVLRVAKGFAVDLDDLSMNVLHNQLVEWREQLLTYLFRKHEEKWINIIEFLDKYEVKDAEDCRKELMIVIENENLQGIAAMKGGHPSDWVIFRRQSSMKDLKDVYQHLQTTFAPLEPYKDVILFFYSRESWLFHHFLCSSLEERPCHLQTFTVALQKTDHFLRRIPQGEATYQQLEDLGFFKKTSARRKEYEIKCLRDFFLSSHSADGSAADYLRGFNEMTALLGVVEALPRIDAVCNTLSLTSCLEDEGFKRLKQIHATYSSEEKKGKLTSKAAVEEMEEVRRVLGGDQFHLRVLDLFDIVEDCMEFRGFLMRYESPAQGKDKFLDLHDLVSQYLQNEEYDEALFNQILTARQYMKPFLDTGQTFEALIEGVLEASGEAIDYSELLEVSKNINKVEEWFSRAEDNTLESVMKDFEQIVQTGWFVIMKPESTTEAQDCCTLTVKYKPTTALLSTEHTTQSEEWLDDFNRRLGLLERKEVDSKQWKVGMGVMQAVDLFQYNYKIAKRILSEWNKLAYLRYTDDKSCFEMCCRAEHSSSDKELEKWKAILSSWGEHLDDVQKSHSQLLLLMIPKIFHISSLLKKEMIEEREKIEELVKDILYFFKPKEIGGCQLVELVKDVVSESLQTYDDPFENAGKFLDKLFSHEKLRKHAYWVQQSDHESESCRFQSTVHAAFSMDQKQMIRELTRIYNGIPHPSMIYHCSRNCTEKDIESFYRRACHYRSHGVPFTLIDPHLLPLKLQEVIANLHKAALKANCLPNIHYVTNGPSLMEDMPRVVVKRTTKAITEEMSKELKQKCRILLITDNAVFQKVELVYGRTGDGKCHYIRQKLKTREKMTTVTVTIDESFSILEAIAKLRTLPMTEENAVFLNFTLLPISGTVSSKDKKSYEDLRSLLQWFLFDLFFMGYIEDKRSGLSFHLPRGLKWTFYIKVPSREYGEVANHSMYSLQENDAYLDAKKSLADFLEDFPILEMLGEPYRVDCNIPLEVDANVQIVCKYLQALDRKGDMECGINKRFRGHIDEKVSFESMPDISKRECHRLLSKYMPQHAKLNKMMQTSFVKYMVRRCAFLERCPAFNFNEGKMEDGSVDTSKFGSVLIEAMCSEVDDFCSPRKRSTWEGHARQQLVYVVDKDEEGGSFEVVSLNADEIPEGEKEKFKKLQIPIHNRETLEKRENLDKYVASAFGVEMEKTILNGREIFRLREIDEKQYVLTLDFAMKMLEINERYWAGIPVLIEGETGVGKTFLVEMMSELWNKALINKWNRSHSKLWMKLEKLCGSVQRWASSSFSHLETTNALQKIAGEATRKCKNSSNADVEQKVDGVQDLDPLALSEFQEFFVVTHSITDIDVKRQWEALHREVNSFVVEQPLLPLLSFDGSKLKHKPSKEAELNSGEYLYLTPKHLVGALSKSSHNPKVIASALLHLLKAATPKVYYKKNIHGALTIKHMTNFLKPIMEQAKEVKLRWKDRTTCPRVIVFLDEINTTSCPGLMKEILIDHTLHDDEIPDNVFIIGACNPHRGHSIVVHENMEDSERWDWVKGSYYVHKLHPSLRCLLWNYGALDERQEKKYIEAKMKMTLDYEIVRLASSASSPHLKVLSEKIAESQNMIRRYAADHYKKSKEFEDDEAVELSKSCVSQRDIQRVFSCYEWLLKTYTWFKQKHVKSHPCYTEDSTRLEQRAILVSLALTYYFRLNNEYRGKYRKEMDGTYGALKFSKVIQEEMDFYCDSVYLPHGIAKTQALKENMFCIIVCCCTQLPLIIVGEPGSSKTLSFNMVVRNFRGSESKKELLRDTRMFPCFDPHYYQCSRRTTSVEVESIFQRAIKRQLTQGRRRNLQGVVFMDEAGLPEESMESLKILHKYLDDPQVSFVGITNHILDAAKTNRAVTLFRPLTDDNVTELAKGCFRLIEDDEEDEGEFLTDLCDAYLEILKHKKLQKFFGLRDFIHFLNHLRRKVKGDMRTLENKVATANFVMGGIERNFNGVGAESFKKIKEEFLSEDIPVEERSIMDILHESLDERPFFIDQEDFEEIRYKLIIDPTEDDSSRRLIMMYGLLHPESTRTFVISDFPDDGDLHKINVIADITHAASQGETVIMSQTDDIHESFYDLFNQHFRKIQSKKEGGKQTHFYAKVAIGSHSKPCRIDPKFQCVVIIKESELSHTPAPFLNRFEKYKMAPGDIFETIVTKLPFGLETVVRESLDSVKEFVYLLDSANFCGLQASDTVLSLFLRYLPSRPRHCESFDTAANLEPGEEMVLNKQFFSDILDSLEGIGFSLDKDEDDIDNSWDIITNYSKNRMQTVLKHNPDASQLTQSMKAASSDILCRDGRLRLLPQHHLLVRMLSKYLFLQVVRVLLQLLTPETLILGRMNIHSHMRNWSIRMYLKQQNHFSLMDLIERLTTSHHGKLVKTVCYTQSSQAVHLFTGNNDYASGNEDILTESLSDQSFGFSSVMFCSLSAVSSQQGFSEMMIDFMASEEKNIMLIKANTQEASKKLINYVRLKIDEEDERLQSVERNGNKKSFVILLHSPTSLSRKTVYPALFFYGWDYHYLDSLIASTECSVPLNEWFLTAYQQHDIHTEGLSVNWQMLLKDIAPTIASRVKLHRAGARASEVSEQIQKTTNVIEHLLASEVGTQLCRIYSKYWSPKKIRRFLHGAASYSRGCKSMLSISDLVQTEFENTFHNFLAYMFHHIHMRFNCHTYHEETQDLFLAGIEFIAPPKTLEDVKGYSNNWDVSDDDVLQAKAHHFPGFSHLCSVLEKLMDKKFKEFQVASESAHQLTEHQYDQVLQTIEESQNRHVAMVLEKLQNNDCLWERYERDFITFKFEVDLDSEECTAIVEEILRYFSVSGDSILKNVIQLHYLIFTQKVNLGELVSTVKPLLSKSEQGDCHLPITKIAHVLTDQGDSHDSDLASVIIDSLFKYLQACRHDIKLLKEWHQTCLQMYFTSSLEHKIYASPLIIKESSCRSQFTIIRSAFLLLQSRGRNVMFSVQAQAMWMLHEYLTQQMKLLGPGSIGLKEVLFFISRILSVSQEKENVSNSSDEEQSVEKKVAEPSDDEQSHDEESSVEESRDEQSSPGDSVLNDRKNSSSVDDGNKEEDTSPEFLFKFGGACAETLSAIEACSNEFTVELLGHFFHQHLPFYHEDDVISFFTFVNNSPFEDLLSNDKAVVPLRVLRYYLLEIMCNPTTNRNEEPNRLLPEREEQMVQFLLKEEDAVGNYCPFFYPEQEKVGIMNQSLVHLYFLVFLESERRRREGRKETLYHLVLNIQQLQETSGEVMVKVQTQALIQFLLFEVANVMSNPVQLIDFEGDQTRKAVLDVLKGPLQLCHKTVIIMYIQQTVKEKSKHAAIEDKLSQWFEDSEEQKTLNLEVLSQNFPFYWKQDEIREKLHSVSLSCPKEQLIVILDRLVECQEKLTIGFKMLPPLFEVASLLKGNMSYHQFEQIPAHEMSLDEVKVSRQKHSLKRKLKDLRDLTMKYNMEGITFNSLSDILLIGDNQSNNVTKLIDEITHKYERICRKVPMYCSTMQVCTQWTPEKASTISISSFVGHPTVFRRPLTQADLFHCLRQGLPAVGNKLDRSFSEMFVAVFRAFLAGVPCEISCPEAKIFDLFHLSLKSVVIGNEELNILNELKTIREHLIEHIQEEHLECPENIVRDMITHFHGVNHEVLQSLMNAIKLVLRHLIKQKYEMSRWLDHTLEDFLKYLNSSWSSFQVIIKLPRYAALDIQIMDNLQVQYLFGVLELFTGWTEHGFYNFHTLPLGVKKPLPVSVESDMNKKAQGDTTLEDFISLEDAIPSDIMGLGWGEIETSTFDESLSEYIHQRGICRKESLLSKVPDEVQVQHYVHFVLFLRRLTKPVRSTAMSEYSDSEESYLDLEDLDDGNDDISSYDSDISEDTFESQPTSSEQNSTHVVSSEDELEASTEYKQTITLYTPSEIPPHDSPQLHRQDSHEMLPQVLHDMMPPQDSQQIRPPQISHQLQMMPPPGSQQMMPPQDLQPMKSLEGSLQTMPLQWPQPIPPQGTQQMLPPPTSDQMHSQGFQLTPSQSSEHMPPQSYQQMMPFQRPHQMPPQGPQQMPPQISDQLPPQNSESMSTQGSQQIHPQDFHQKRPHQISDQISSQGGQQTPTLSSEHMLQGYSQMIPPQKPQLMPHQEYQWMMPPQGLQQMPPQGPQQMPPQGPQQMPTQGPLQMPPQGPQQIPPEGPYQMPPQGPQQMPPEGPYQMPPEGPQLITPQGPQQIPPEGPYQMPPQGPHQMPPQGPPQMPHQGPQQMSNQSSQQMISPSFSDQMNSQGFQKTPSQSFEHMPPGGYQQTMPFQGPHQMPPQISDQMPPQISDQKPTQEPQKIPPQDSQGVQQAPTQGPEHMPSQGYQQMIPPQGPQQMLPQGYQQMIPTQECQRIPFQASQQIRPPQNSQQITNLQGPQQMMPPQDFQQMRPQIPRQMMHPQGRQQMMPPQGHQQMHPQGYQQMMLPQGYQQMPHQSYQQMMPPQGYQQVMQPNYSQMVNQNYSSQMQFALSLPQVGSGGYGYQQQGIPQHGRLQYQYYHQQFEEVPLWQQPVTETARRMTAEDISKWLIGIGMPQYADGFLHHGVNGMLLESLSDDNLIKELGVKSVLDSKKIITEFRNIGRQ